MMRPSLEIVVAMTQDRVIGADNVLPWSLPEDQKLFRRLTLGNTVIMGAKTFHSIGAPLKGRHNIVLTKSLEIDGVLVCRSFLEGLAKAWELGRPTFIIGGTELYRKALKIADGMHISWIRRSYPGNRYFPDFEMKEWLVIEKQAYKDFDYITYRRNKESQQTKRAGGTYTTNPFLST